MVRDFLGTDVNGSIHLMSLKNFVPDTAGLITKVRLGEL